jgi:probable F420-dependent oxidoreductase
VSGLKVRIGYSAGAVGADDPAGFTRLVDRLEALGFDSVWVPEVLTAASLDPLTALGFAAGRTSRLKLGSHLVAPGRNPARLAKELATLDRVSEGRLLLTFVIGLPEGPELSAGGVAREDRTAVLDETLGLLRRLWNGERVTHRSDFFQLDDVGIQPTPHQVPLEVWFGGLLPGALRRCGRLADGWIPGLITPERAAEAKAVIDAAATDAGRRIDPEHFGANVTYSRGPLPAEVRARLAARYRVDDPADLVPDSLEALVERLTAFVAVGFSKFVLRPAVTGAIGDGELEALAAAVLPLQQGQPTAPAD